MLKKYLQFIIIILIQFPLFFCEHQSDINLNHDNLFSSQWVQTSGPAGGFINDIAMHPDNEKILYAAGSFVGIYKKTDGGETWELLPFIETQRNELIEVDPHNGNILYSDHNNFSKSTDGGRTWQGIMISINAGETWEDYNQGLINNIPATNGKRNF